MTRNDGEDKKPRALVVGFNNLYLNETDDVFYRVLDDVFDTFYYGPGYTPLAELKDSLVQVYDEFGPFELCFIHQYVLHNLISNPGAIVNEKNDVQRFLFNKKTFYKNNKRFGYDFNELPCKRFLLSMRLDYYAFTSREQEEFDVFDGYIIASSPDVIAPVSCQYNIHDPNFNIESTDLYINYMQGQLERLIPLSHLVSIGEFSHIDISNKKHEVVVPGCRYYEREAVANILKSTKIRFKDQLFLSSLMLIAQYKLNLPLLRTKAGLSLMKSNFRRLIEQSIIAFTDGSKVRAPIRKFFEIPALGAVLLADPFYNAHQLGFVESENYIRASSDNIEETVRCLLSNTDYVRELSSKAQDMIYERHSDIAWCKYIKDIVDRIQCGTFSGARWHDGKLYY